MEGGLIRAGLAVRAAARAGGRAVGAASASGEGPLLCGGGQQAARDGEGPAGAQRQLQTAARDAEIRYIVMYVCWVIVVAGVLGGRSVAARPRIRWR